MNNQERIAGILFSLAMGLLWYFKQETAVIILLFLCVLDPVDYLLKRSIVKGK